MASLVGAAAASAAQDRVSLLELRSRGQLPGDDRWVEGWQVSKRKVTVLLDLPASRDVLWKSFDGKLRSQVRRPEKEGVEVRFGADQMGAFYSVFARHMRDLGTPVQSRRFFEEILTGFPNDVWFGAAYLGSEPIAGGCGFCWGSEFEMTWASSLVEHKQIAPNMLLYWRFMERAVDEGLSVFNFGRCTTGSGTHRFKKQWGSRDEELWWYGRGGSSLVEGVAAGNGNGADRAVAKTPSPDDGAYAWGPRVWRHIPVWAANVIGPRIVKYIP